MQVFGHDQSIRKTVPEVCLLSNHVINFVYGRWGNLVKTMNQQWLAPVNLQPFADTIHASESPLDNCWVFIDGIVRPICRPRKDQRILHNGHKKVHAIKFQSVVARNGLIANLYGPVEYWHHNNGMLGNSGLFHDLQQYTYGPNNNIICLYGDPAYPLWPQLLGLFQVAAITPLQNSLNKAMSQLRVSVEWSFWRHSRLPQIPRLHKISNCN